VVAQLVPLFDDAARDLRPRLDAPADREERRAGAVARERVEHGRRHLGIGAVVERQRHALRVARTMREGGIEHARAGPQDAVREQREEHGGQSEREHRRAERRHRSRGGDRVSQEERSSA
jgi:hypothetical protein